MAEIKMLDQKTINQIAAGEVVERPCSVVKELTENAMDAKATMITVEIKEGGIDFIRVTDNGFGIEKEQVETAFLPHATSKIRTIEDLLEVGSLGFRGEALASIASVSKVEVITKTDASMTGVRYQIEGGQEISREEIGCPVGTTFLIKHLFYNTPARRKFLKSKNTEAGYIEQLLWHLALSHPEVAFKFIVNNKNKLNTNGNGNLKDVIYQIYGKETAMNLIAIKAENSFMKIEGFVAKPTISKGNRSEETYFVNKRYIRSKLIGKAIEEAFKGFTMVHKYPFTVLHIEIQPQFLDVNVHPTKMEVRMKREEEVYSFLYTTIREALERREMIPNISFSGKSRESVKAETTMEPFETVRSLNVMPYVKPKVLRERGDFFERENRIEKRESTPEQQLRTLAEVLKPKKLEPQKTEEKRGEEEKEKARVEDKREQIPELERKEEQLSLFTAEEKEKQNKKYKMIGSLFDTYWLLEGDNQLFIFDQHAAHEKVLFEKFMKQKKEQKVQKQQLNPPIVITVPLAERELIGRYQSQFLELGFTIEEFGKEDYCVRTVPANLYGLNEKDVILEMLDQLCEDGILLESDKIFYKIASMSCKAAVKGNQRLSLLEAEALVEQLLSLENPYTCPHGRPIFVSLSKTEIEKMFKRIQS